VRRPYDPEFIRIEQTSPSGKMFNSVANGSILLIQQVGDEAINPEIEQFFVELKKQKIDYLIVPKNVEIIGEIKTS
jgi:hypothetical protein